MSMEIEEYSQYGRQMIVPEMGLQGQLRLRNASILVVGAGGLGSPAIEYLAGAGIGSLGIVDPDLVETSNLHRQVIHRTTSVGLPKAESAAKFVTALNPKVKVHAYTEAFGWHNALDIASSYDVILDCTDRPASRYLINDVAVVLNKPLVSASALRAEGQLAVYHYKDGPCYRCLFPKPPPPETVTACGDGGILGPVVGVMGVLQALEAIKVIAMPDLPFTPSLTLFSGLSFPPWRTMRIRGRQVACEVCGDHPTIDRKSLLNGDIDYTAWCGSDVTYPLDPELRMDPRDLDDLLAHQGTLQGTIVDVRPAVQFGIAALPGSVNIPLTRLKQAQSLDELGLSSTLPIVTVCRFGNDSQTAVRMLQKLGASSVRDLRGGLALWTDTVDPKFPKY